MNATRCSCRVYKNHQLKFKIQITFNNYSFFIIFLKKFTMGNSKINYQTHSLRGQEYQSSDSRSTWRVFCRLLISYRLFRTTNHRKKSTSSISKLFDIHCFTKCVHHQHAKDIYNSIGNQTTQCIQ